MSEQPLKVPPVLVAEVDRIGREVHTITATAYLCGYQQALQKCEVIEVWLTTAKPRLTRAQLTAMVRSLFRAMHAEVDRVEL